MGFIFAIGDAIRGITIRNIKVEDLDPKDVAVGLIDLIDTLGNWVDEIPPAEQQQRFGNKAFREWHKRMSEVSNGADIGRVGEIVAEGGVGWGNIILPSQGPLICKYLHLLKIYRNRRNCLPFRYLRNSRIKIDLKR